jgi:integrase
MHSKATKANIASMVNCSILPQGSFRVVVDLGRRSVTIFRSRNGERRTIPVNDTVLQILKEKARVRSLETDRVFCSKISTAMESGHLRRAFRLALGKASIEDFHFHDLRHTFAMRLVQAGVDMYKVQRLLGHKSSIMTQQYASLSGKSS